MAEPVLDLDALEVRALELRQERLAAERVAALQREEDPRGDLSTRQRGESSLPPGVAIDVALEGGLPAAAQFVASPLTPGGQAIVGGFASGVGNLLAQTRRRIFDEQEGFKTGQFVQAIGTGSIPFIGPAKNMARVSNPVWQGTKAIGKNVLVQGATGYAGKVAETEIDEGRMPGLGESLLASVLPAVMSGLGTQSMIKANTLEEQVARFGANADIYDRAGVRATAGMLDPESLAGLEQRIIGRNPRGEYSQAADTAATDFMSGTQRLAGSPPESAEIFGQVEPYLHTLRRTETDLRKLDGVAQAAQEKAQVAIRNLREVKTGTAMEEAKEAVDTAFTENVRSVLGNAQMLAVAKTTAGQQGKNPAVVNELWTEHVAQPARAAFKEKAAQLFEVVPADVAAFDTAAIYRKTSELVSSSTMELPTVMSSAVKDVHSLLPQGAPATLTDLRRLKDRLADRADFAAFNDPTSREVTKLISEIQDTIKTQATKVYGEKVGGQLLQANEFYREYRQLFDRPGVKVLFAEDPMVAKVGTLLNQVRESGMEAPMVKDMTELISKMERVALGEAVGGPEMAKTLKRLTQEQIEGAQGAIQSMRGVLIDNIRDSIFHKVSSFDTASGSYRVNGDELVKWLDDIGRTPGSLEQLGFGGPSRVDELKTLFAKYPDAPDMTTKQWGQLLATPSFSAAAEGVKLSPSLHDAFATASADTRFTRAGMLRSAGKFARAQEEADAAEDLLRTANMDAGRARAVFDSQNVDPIYQALNNERISPGSYEALHNSFFKSKSSATTADLTAVVTALENGPRPAKQLLEQWRERFIADTFQTFRDSAATSGLLRSPDTKQLALFFNPANPGDAGEIIKKAERLLSPAQMSRLRDLGTAAVEYENYQQLGKATRPKPASTDVPLVGVARRVFDVTMDKLVREPRYERVARAVADPAAFVREESARVRSLRSEAEYFRGSGMGTARAIGNQDSSR